MAETWREQLKAKIHERKAAGGLGPAPAEICFTVELTTEQLNAFNSRHGRVNDLPFGEAPAGTLEIGLPMYWEDGKFELVFLLHDKPVKDFGSSKGLMSPRGPGGEFPRVVTGIDFDKDLP